MYANSLTHVELTQTDSRPTLAFDDTDRTIMIVFSGIGNARNSPEGMPSGHSFFCPETLVIAIFINEWD
jgi:hypothetical protein